MVERIDIDNLLLFVDRHPSFMEAFEHVLGRYQKVVASKPTIVATLMAYATNIGLKKGVVAYTLLANHVPVVWQHINFYGRYQFDTDFTPIDFARLREQLSSEEVSRLYTVGKH